MPTHPYPKLPMFPVDLPDPAARQAYVDAVMRGDFSGQWPEDWDGETGVTPAEQRAFYKRLDWNDRSWEAHADAETYPIDYYGERVRLAEFKAFVEKHKAHLTLDRGVSSLGGCSGGVNAVYDRERGIMRALYSRGDARDTEIYVDRGWERALEARLAADADVAPAPGPR